MTAENRENERIAELEAEIKRLREALKAIRVAPGGGPGKRIATMALKQAEEE